MQGTFARPDVHFGTSLDHRVEFLDAATVGHHVQRVLHPSSLAMLGSAPSSIKATPDASGTPLAARPASKVAAAQLLRVELVHVAAGSSVLLLFEICDEPLQVSLTPHLGT